jgi:uncharacterized protein (TIGR03066 family)
MHSNLWQPLQIVGVLLVGSGMAAGRDNSEQVSRIVGVWELVKTNGNEPPIPVTLEFTNKGKLIARLGENGDLGIAFGAYTLRDNILVTSMNLFEQEQERKSVIKSLSTESMRIVDFEKNTSEYRRKK